MDLQSFWVENRRKGNSFPFLRSALQSTGKMSKSVEFGVPVSGRFMDENFKNIHDNSCNTQFTFPDVPKNQDCHSKKTCFDPFHKLSHIAFSKVVGGFVGSKSQGGSAFREPHQVWDVIFRQLVDSACHATMNNNAQQYINIGEAVSQSIFGQFNNTKDSTLHFSPFLFARQYDFFARQTPSENMQVSNGSQCYLNDVDPSVNKQIKFNKDHCIVQSNSVQMPEIDEMKMKGHQSTAKQSYADVAKTFVASKSESAYKTEKYQCVPMSVPQNRVSHRHSRRGNEKNSKKRQNGNCYSQPSYNNSSQYEHRKSKMLPDKYEEQIPSKYSRNKFENTRHCRTENSSSYKARSKESGISLIPAKVGKDQEERKRKYHRFRNYNMKDKERKIIDNQVHEDIVYACNMPQQECQNWRCVHNRLSSVLKSRVESSVQMRGGRTKNYKQQSRLHSPPPRTFVPDAVKISKSNLNDYGSQKDVNEICKIGEMCKETLCNVEKPNFSTSLNLASSGDNNSESLLSSSPISSTCVLPLRPRVASECSLDSEDSSVVFERDECDLQIESESDCDSDLDSVSDYSSECDSNEDCDEVDFCYVTPPDDIQSVITGSLCADVYSPLPDRLNNINARWRKENNEVSRKEKVPKKVHFPGPEKLAKVHHMIHWPFAYRAARRGPWEEIGRDRCRFQMRIERAEQDLSRILDPEHRRRIWKERMCDLDST